jgi:chromosome segregation ATPase
MNTKGELENSLKALEEEYRFWMVEMIKMGRGIEIMEEELAHYDDDLGLERAADLRRRLAFIREKHEVLEEKILTVRHRLEELRKRLERMGI